jgi:hypothetical protein
MYCRGQFLIGDGDFDDAVERHIPRTTDLLRWDSDTHQFYLVLGGIKTKLGIDLSSLVTPPLTAEIVIEEISDQIYEELGNNPNRDGQRNPEFKIARTQIGEDGIYQIMSAQLRYAYRTGENLKEYNEPISKRAMTLMKSQKYGYLWSRGQVLLVNPDETADNGYRNDY